MSKIIFKHPDQDKVYKPLLDAVNKLCADKKQDANCVSGYRSLECQKATNKSVLQSTPRATQRADGSVYSNGKCLAAAYGKSNHCYCIAMDIDSPWFKALTNAQLKPYGLIKPMDYEPWHVQLIEHKNLTQTQKEAIRNDVLNPKVDELKESLLIICKETGIDYSHWYKKAKEVKFLDVAFIKIASTLRRYVK